MRVSAPVLIALGAVVGLIALGITDQVLPATDARTAELRPWIAARALGVTAYLLLALEVGLGLVMSHPRNSSDWRRSGQVLPWHEMVTVFLGAFLALHIVLLAIDPYANVGIVGALVPGFSAFRPVAVALGSVALYALLITAVTARWTRLLPSGWWLRIHRFAAVAFLLTWVHAVLAGADGGALLPLYLITGLAILAGVMHRWWVTRSRPRREAPEGPITSGSLDRQPSTALVSEES
jgi:sulfoxide reductase heme-binding subunit YedZ